MTPARLGHDEGMVDPYLMEGRKNEHLWNVRRLLRTGDGITLQLSPRRTVGCRTRVTNPRPR